MIRRVLIAVLAISALVVSLVVDDAASAQGDERGPVPALVLETDPVLD